ncbi:MAG: hypothetical protein ACQESK_02245 [Bacteroidota bacterium]
MKCRFYLFGFVFSLLIALIIYVNSTKTYEAQKEKINQLEEKIELLEKQKA